MNAPERPPDSILRPLKSRHCFGSNELIWDGLRLRLRTVDGPVMATVEPDASRPGMWRGRFGGRVSDRANVSRAKDGAISLLLSGGNRGSHANKTPPRG